MGIFDIFNTDDQEKAAQAQIQGLTAGNTLATGNINQGINSLNTNYAAALQPYLQNYGQAQPGVTQLGNVLGLNGASGNASALSTLENTPGYQFQLQQGNNAITAADAASGKTSSGNEKIALANYNQGLAGTTYNNYVSQLQPFLQASNAAAGGIAGVNTGLGNAVAGQQDSLANLNWQTQTGAGNANANADLAGLQASGNFWNFLGGLGGMKTSGGGTLGGNAVSSLFSGGGGGAVPGAIGATSVGGAELAGGGGLAGLGAIFSDERLKEFIEPVGSLYDGTNVYRYQYKGDATPRIGLIAQEVERTNPDAVVEIGGYKAVDYGRATQYASELSRFLEAA